MRKSRGIGSRAWERIRQQVLDRDGWRCRQCGFYGNEVHHVIPVWRNGPIFGHP